MRLIQFAAAFLAALVVSAAFLPTVIRWAKRQGLVDRPGGRRMHSGEIPRLGGVGIFLGFVAGIGSALLAGGMATVVSEPGQYPWYGATIGLVLVFAGGVLDDLFQFTWKSKLAIQVAGSALAVIGGLRIDAVTSPMGGTLELGPLAPLAAFAWILLITNAMNLIDGLDGLAGGVALITTVTVASVALAMDRFAAIVVAFALAGAILGFLWHNFHPARIFMGDGGSQFLGFALALVSLRGSQKGPTAVAILVPMLALGLPILDLFLTIVRRAVRVPGTRLRDLRTVAARIVRADRGHLHHNLLDLGLSPIRAVLVLYLLAALFAFAAYLAVARNTVPLALLTVAIPLASVAWIKRRAWIARPPGGDGDDGHAPSAAASLTARTR